MEILNQFLGRGDPKSMTDASHNKSSFEVQFNFHSFEDKGNFANYDKEMIVKIF